MELSGVYNLISKKNTFYECDCWCIDNEDCSGRVLCNEKYTHPYELVEYIKQKGRGKLCEDGLFLAVICYKGNLHIFADSSTSQWVLYYTKTGNNFYYSTSLKKLLKASKIKRGMDIVAAKGFLKNGIVLGDRTLISQVKKLGVCEMLTVRKGKIRTKHINYGRIKRNTNLIASLRQSVRKYSEGLEKVFIPLSAGFDSNLILDTLKRDGNKVEAFTIGGETGKNEIPLVEQNIKNYDNTALHTYLANKSVFSKLPEIIWRLDGYVYERGIFLQYLLARLVSDNGGKTLICGECSDEHQHLLYGKERKRCAHNNISPLETFDYLYQPYTFGNFVVMKKSALMLNSFGISGCYPFATKQFTDSAISVSKRNLDNKQLYIDLLKNELPKEVYENLSHAGGSTSIEAIISEEDKKLIKTIIDNNILIHKIKDETADCYKPFWVDFAEIYLGEKGKMNFNVTIAYIKFIIKKLLSMIGLCANKTEEIENSLETDIKCYYLIVFSELFLSGRFDLYFDKNKIDFDNNFLGEI